MSLKNKRILITAGPTWVPIDSVRVISNIATGETGILLAQEAVVQGARVTLLLGPCGIGKNKISPYTASITRFCFFNELKKALKCKLKNTRYDIVIHSAAVSDFYPALSTRKRLSVVRKGGVKPEYKLKGKLSSDRPHSFKLVPLEKLVILIRSLAPKAKLVMFKLGSGMKDLTLIKRAGDAREKIGADLVVANRLNPYRAFIIDKEGNQIKVRNKQELAKKLMRSLDMC